MADETSTQRSVGANTGVDSRLGELLNGRYRVTGFIGAGGMGVVYEGEHVHIGRRVAIKFIRRDLAARPKILDRFRFEARAAGQLASDNVASVLDFGVTGEGDFYLVMERLCGETLAQRLVRRCRLPSDEAARLVAQASRGAAAAHGVDVIHCDLKPSNLFIAVRDDGTEIVKLLDFGVAQLLTSADDRRSSATHRVTGTPCYMSPEQASARGPIDARTDVYALGVILYQTLCGELPHPGSDPMAIRCRILRDKAPLVHERQPDVPAALAEIVHRALAANAADRHSSAQKLAEDLEGFVVRGAPSGSIHSRRVEPLPETLADPATRAERDSNSSSGIRHAVALDVGARPSRERRRHSLQRWFLALAVLFSAGVSALSTSWRKPATSEAEYIPPWNRDSNSMGARRLLAQSVSMVNAELAAPVRLGTIRTATALASSHGRAPLAIRRAATLALEPTASVVAASSVDPKPPSELPRKREAVGRNYDKLVGF